MSFDAESQRSWGQTKVPQNPPLYQGGVPQVVVDGDDEFFQVHRQVENSLKQMVQNFGQIMFASERLGTERDTVDFRDQLKQKIETTKELAKEITALMKRLEYINTTSSQGTKERRRLIDKLETDFQSFEEKYKSLIKEVTRKMDDFSPKPPKIPTPSSQSVTAQSSRQYQYADDTNDNERQSLIEAERRQQELARLENESIFMQNLIEERDQEIKAIQSQMVEVNQLFVDLNSLVAQQREFVDNIETNTEMARQQVTKGVVELRKANEYQQASRSKLCFVLLIVALIVAVIVIIVVIQVKKWKSKICVRDRKSVV